MNQVQKKRKGQSLLGIMNTILSPLMWKWPRVWQRWYYPVDLIGTSPWIRKFLLVKYKDPRWEIVYRFPFHCYDWIGLGLDSGLSIIFLRMSLSSPQVVATARASPSPARATSWWRPGSRGWLSPQPRHLGGESQRPTLRSPSSISSRWEQSRYTWSIWNIWMSEFKRRKDGKRETKDII